jgi:hypothetical protein
VVLKINIKTMATLQDYFKGINTGYKPWTLPQTPLFTTTTQTLPNAGGTYKSVTPVLTRPPVYNPATVPPPAPAPAPAPSAPPVVTSSQPPVSNIPSKYFNKDTGKAYTPQEYADKIRIGLRSTGGADITQYALDSFAQKDQTAEQMYQTAYGLNNARNDIATGTTDPYGVASRSGISYSPSELTAIEKAYAGVYDPALGSALAKLEAKQKSDEANVAFQREVALKQIPQATAEPTSYREWTLAGKPGTYADFLKTAKAPTAAQYLVAEYAARAEQSIPQIESIQNDIVKMNYADFEIRRNLPAVAQGSVVRQYMQAARNFINAKMRRESGAVISATEFEDARKQYLPQPGDDAKTLKMKKDNRDLIYVALKNAAGNAYQSVDELMGITSKLNKTGDVLTSPDGKYEVSTSELTPAELKEAQDAGWQ